MLLESGTFIDVSNTTILSNDRTPVRVAFGRLRDLLPKKWVLMSMPVQIEAGPMRWPDAIWQLSAPDGSSLTIVVEAKSRVEPRDVPVIAMRLDEMRSLGEPLLVAPFLSERTQALLGERRIPFVDAQGNVFVTFDRPAIVVRTPAVTKGRAPDERPRRSLRGPVTGRVVRFVCDFRPPFGVREIATRTNVNPGGVSRILDFMDRESYIVRNKKGLVTSVDWRALLRRWADDLVRDRRDRLFFSPRGLNDLKRRLQGAAVVHVVSGSWAASFFALVAPPAEAFVYVRSVDTVGAALELKQSGRTTNVRLIEAFDRVVFERSKSRDGLTIAAPTQILADLWSAGVRSRDEVAAFERWMGQNEDAWRPG